MPIAYEVLEGSKIKTIGEKPDTKIGESIDKLLKGYYGKSFKWSSCTVTKMTDKVIGNGFIVRIELI